METVGLQERYREPEMVETGVSNAELKITPELSGRRDASAAHDRPGRVSRVMGTHMMVCSNRWLKASGPLSCYRMGPFLFHRKRHSMK